MNKKILLLMVVGFFSSVAIYGMDSLFAAPLDDENLNSLITSASMYGEGFMPISRPRTPNENQMDVDVLPSNKHRVTDCEYNPWNKKNEEWSPEIKEITMAGRRVVRMPVAPKQPLFPAEACASNHVVEMSVADSLNNSSSALQVRKKSKLSK
ncbi:MAG: hypothetical protein Q8Q60_05285 [Candidatus Chromulinivorax sp.]|nr:hypothetical protein [Candidatus Chromulinivorax sp.]